MDLGASAYAEVAVGETLGDLGTPIIAEVTLLTTELVIVVELEALQPSGSEEE